MFLKFELSEITLYLTVLRIQQGNTILGEARCMFLFHIFIHIFFVFVLTPQ